MVTSDRVTYQARGDRPGAEGRSGARGWTGDWIAQALSRFEYTVGSLVPPIYTLYSRVLHPAARIDPDPGERVPVRWAEVAAHTGGVTRPSSGARCYRPACITVSVTAAEPSGTKNPTKGTCRKNSSRRWPMSSCNTTTPDDCWFGFWEGRAGHGMNLPHPGPRRPYSVPGKLPRARHRARCRAHVGVVRAGSVVAPGSGVVRRLGRRPDVDLHWLVDCTLSDTPSRRSPHDRAQRVGGQHLG